MAHLAAARPRVLYLMLGETDDWSHDGRYDRVLQTLALTDAWFKELWTWLQSQDDYRDKTTILITTDHGRGNTPADWGTHGAKIEGAQYTWLAAIGPDFPSAANGATRRRSTRIRSRRRWPRCWASAPTSRRRIPAAGKARGCADQAACDRHARAR